MVRSPGPVHAGFGLDDGEVLQHLAVVALGLFGFRHYSRNWTICQSRWISLR